MKNTLDRRRLLRGMMTGAGVAIGLPCLEAMLDDNGDAHADGTPLPQRFGLWFFGAGTHPGWTPLTPGQLVLPEGLTALQRHRDYINLVSGLECESFGDYGTNRHTMGCSSVLAGAPPAPGHDMQPGAATIDQLVAKSLTSSGPRSSLEVAIAYEEAISFSDVNTPNRPTRDPRQLFQAVFGGLMPSVGSGVDTKALRAAYLDAVQDDIRELNLKLGKADRDRMAQYLEGLNELQKEVASLPRTTSPTTCVPPNDALVDIDDAVISSNESGLSAINRANSKILAAALACDLTRVFTVNFSTFNSGPWFPLDPSLPNNHHELGHQSDPNMSRSVGFIMERFAEFLDALASFSEGANHILYNSSILVQSEVARNHELENMPTLMAGNAGGVLRTGLHVKASGPTTRASFTAAKAVGAALSSFGVQGAQTSEAISDVLA
ncbi:MAG: DUF1552 domain-containing protein [Polyangiaceae bacterium]|nr:DUF1552 domain-containing protein [Polyangiaceae bacterium]